MNAKMSKRVNETYRQHFLLLTICLFMLQLGTITFKVLLYDKYTQYDTISKMTTIAPILLTFANLIYYIFLKKFDNIPVTYKDILYSLEKLPALFFCPIVIALFQFYTLYLLKTKVSFDLYIIGSEIINLVYGMVHVVTAFCIYDYFSISEYSADSHIERALAREEARRQDNRQMLGILSVAIQITFSKWKIVCFESILYLCWNIGFIIIMDIFLSTFAGNITYFQGVTHYTDLFSGLNTYILYMPIHIIKAAVSSLLLVKIYICLTYIYQDM